MPTGISSSPDGGQTDHAVKPALLVPKSLWLHSKHFISTVCSFLFTYRGKRPTHQLLYSYTNLMKISQGLVNQGGEISCHSLSKSDFSWGSSKLGLQGFQVLVVRLVDLQGKQRRPVRKFPCKLASLNSNSNTTFNWEIMWTLYRQKYKCLFLSFFF